MGLQITSGGVYADSERFTSPPDEPTRYSDQMSFGPASVLVEWHVEFGETVIDGAWIAGELVDADRFAGWQRDIWRTNIQRSRDSERAEFESDRLELPL